MQVFLFYFTCTAGLRHEQTNGQRDKRTDARNQIWCILALKCDIWWQ